MFIILKWHTACPNKLSILEAYIEGKAQICAQKNKRDTMTAT